MNVVVTPETRTAIISGPAVFAAGEAVTLSITGLLSPDTASLKLALYTTTGTLLALCETFTSGASPWVGILDTRTAAVDTAFANKRPDHREQVIVQIADVNGLKLNQSVEMVNNSLRGAPSAPDPAKTYLTADLFADVTDLPADASAAEMKAALDAILERLKA
jgi:hypothetical protein